MMSGKWYKSKFVDKWLKILVLIQLKRQNWKTCQMRVVMRKNPLQITLDHFRPATLWSKNSSNHRVAGRKWSRVTCKGFFRPALIQYNKIFDLQSFLMMVVLLLLLYENEYCVFIIHVENWVYIFDILI